MGSLLYSLPFAIVHSNLPKERYGLGKRKVGKERKRGCTLEDCSSGKKHVTSQISLHSILYDFYARGWFIFLTQLYFPIKTTVRISIESLGSTDNFIDAMANPLYTVSGLYAHKLAIVSHGLAHPIWVWGLAIWDLEYIPSRLSYTVSCQGNSQQTDCNSPDGTAFAIHPHVPLLGNTTKYMYMIVVYSMIG